MYGYFPDTPIWIAEKLTETARGTPTHGVLAYTEAFSRGVDVYRTFFGLHPDILAAHSKV